MIIHEAVDAFLTVKRADGASDSTLKWYRAMLKPLQEHLGPGRCQDVRAGDMRALIIALRARIASKATLLGHDTALRAFWRWAAAEMGVPDPMSGIRRPGRPTPRPKAIRAADLKALFQAAGSGWKGARDRALLVMLADTGIRAQGLLTLTLDDLDLTRRRAVVREKFGKTRPVPFTRFTAAYLKRWLAIRPPRGMALFCQSDGRSLTYWGLREILRRLARRAGVTGRTTPHAFRHFAAREYLRQGGDLATLSALLGHADVSTTAAHYAVYDSDEIAARHDQHSPLKSVFGHKPSADAG